MRVSRVLFAALLAVGVLAASPGRSEGPTARQVEKEPPSSALQQDSRLRKLVTFTVLDQPLSRALPDLGATIGVDLRPRPEIADRKISVIVQQRPGDTLLADLASQFDLVWLPTSRGYEAAQSLKARRRDGALLDEDRGAVARALQTRLALVGRALSLTADQRQERRVLVRTREREVRLSGGDPTPLNEELQALSDAQAPETRSALAVLGCLTPPRVQSLLSGEEVRLSRSSNSLPDAVGRLVLLDSQSTPSAAPRSQDGAVVDVEATIDLPGLERMTGARSGGVPDRVQRVRLNVQMAVVRDRGTGRNRDARGWGISIRVPTETEPGPTATDDPTLLKEVTLSPAKTPPASSPAGAARRYFAGHPSEQMLPLGAVAELLHTSSGLDVVTDSYTYARIPAARLGGKRSLVRLLDDIGRWLGYRWTKDGNLLRLRSRRFYADQEAEVPESFLRRWLARPAQAGYVGLDDLATAAATLSRRQFTGLDAYWAWYTEGRNLEAAADFSRLYPLQEDLRFWAALSPAQRQAARTSRPIAVSEMNTAERQALAAVLQGRSTGFDGSLDHAAVAQLTPESLGAVRFVLEVRRGLRQTVLSGSPTRPIAGSNTVFETASGKLSGELNAPRDGSATLLSGLERISFRYLAPGSTARLRSASIVLVGRSRLDP
jgi:hypothetical protein